MIYTVKMVALGALFLVTLPVTFPAAVLFATGCAVHGMLQHWRNYTES